MVHVALGITWSRQQNRNSVHRTRQERYDETRQTSQGTGMSSLRLRNGNKSPNNELFSL